MSKSIQILFSNEEIEELKAKAALEELSIVSYIRSIVLTKDDYGSCYKKLKEKVNTLPSGTRFNIKSLFGIEWLSISTGVKLNLGKTYFNRVNEGIITDVKPIGRDGGHMWYEKL